MILRSPGNRGIRLRLRLGLVTGLVAALLAFPCGPLLTTLGSGAGHAHAAAKVAPAHSEHGGTECSHRATKHESSCCKSCSSWVAARYFDGAKAVVGEVTQHEPLAATPTLPLRYPRPDRNPTTTGPPPAASLDGASIYLKTGRFRI